MIDIDYYYRFMINDVWKKEETNKQKKNTKVL